MKHANSLMVVIDVGEIVDRLQDQVAWVVHDVAARMSANSLEKHLERQSVMEILGGVDLVAKINPTLIEGVQYGPPSFGLLVEAVRNQPIGPLRIRIKI